MQQINRKQEFGWVMFDWANSAYSLVISTALFPSYFMANTHKQINILGFDLSNSSVYAFAVSFAYLLVCLASPILSGIADYGGYRKRFLQFFTTWGSLSCFILYFFNTKEEFWFGITGFILATIGHASSLVFYDAYLPEITTKERYDKVSARGYAFGYIGSVILLMFNIIMINNPEFFNLTDEKHAVRISLVMVGIWWFAFSQFSFSLLPDPKAKDHRFNIGKGIGELKKAWRVVSANIHLKNYLFAFLFYCGGIQTVIYLATTFAEKELHFETKELILVVLILQIVAIGGAYLFSYISKISDNFKSMYIMLCIWILICIIAYFITEKIPFYITAGLVGLVLGGLQALSRSTYSKLIPEETEDRTSLFSFYDVLYYFSIVYGTFAFGFIQEITGSMRNSVLALMLFFMLGLYFLLKIPASELARKK